MKTKVQKRGNILLVRSPRIARKAGIYVNDALEAEVVRGKIVLTPARKEAPANYDLDAMVKKISPRNRYRESDFGKSKGRE